MIPSCFLILFAQKMIPYWVGLARKMSEESTRIQEYLENYVNNNELVAAAMYLDKQNDIELITSTSNWLIANESAKSLVDLTLGRLWGFQSTVHWGPMDVAGTYYTFLIVQTVYEKSAMLKKIAEYDTPSLSLGAVALENNKVLI